MKLSPKNPVLLQLFVFLVVVIYATIGAVVFHILESGKSKVNGSFKIELNENTSKCLKKSLRNAKSHTITDDSNMIQLEKCLKSQVKPKEGADWGFMSSLLFSFTVITTIGYGHVAPTTFGGRLFLIFYALIGIPITLIFLANIGKFMIEGGKLLSQKLKHCLLRQKKENKDGKEMSTSGLFIIGLILYTSLGAVILPFYEEIKFFDAFYFVFVSLTTIGLGDIYPENTAMIFISLVYISFGLALASVAIDVLSHYFKKLHHFGRKLRNIANVQIYFGAKRVTVGNFIGVFADKHGITRPNEEELEYLVDEAVAEGKNPNVHHNEVAVDFLEEQHHDRVKLLHPKRGRFFKQKPQSGRTLKPKVEPEEPLTPISEATEPTLSLQTAKPMLEPVPTQIQETTETPESMIEPEKILLEPIPSAEKMTETKPIPETFFDLLLTPESLTTPESLQTQEPSQTLEATGSIQELLPTTEPVPTSEPTPESMSSSESEPVPSSEPTPEPVPSSESDILPTSEPITEPVPTSEPTPEPLPSSESEAMPSSESDPVPTSEPESIVIPEAVPLESEQTPTTESVSTSEPTSSSSKDESSRKPVLQIRSVPSKPKMNIFNIEESAVPLAHGKVKHDPRRRYEQFQKEWSKFKSPTTTKSSATNKKNTDRQ